jgi:hypothetical protein
MLHNKASFLRSRMGPPETDLTEDKHAESESSSKLENRNRLCRNMTKLFDFTKLCQGTELSACHYQPYLKAL